MEEQICARCGKGPCADGKMHYRGDEWVCSACRRGPVNVDVAKSTFPFSTTNITGEKITVNSLHHLRQLEARHGVISHPYNYDRGEKNERYER